MLDFTWLDSTFVKFLSFVGTIIGIFGVIYIGRKVYIKNRLKNVKIGGDFVGGNSGVENVNEQRITTKIKNSTIKGDYIGGNKK